MVSINIEMAQSLKWTMRSSTATTDAFQRPWSHRLPEPIRPTNDAIPLAQNPRSLQAVLDPKQPECQCIGVGPESVVFVNSSLFIAERQRYSI